MAAELSLHLLCFLLLACLTPTSSSTILPGSSLYASNLTQTWSSPSNTFSLGFSQLSPTSYILSIYYTTAGTPHIWTAGGTNASVDAGGSFHFLPNGSLRLVNGSGATVWDSTSANLGIISAALSDYGNFVLQNETASVWSSFQYPTDTIAQNQNFSAGQVLRSGLYSFGLLGDGNLTLTWNDSVVFWNQALNASVESSNLTAPWLTLQPSGVLSLFDPTLTTGANIVYSSDYGEGSDVMRFLRLDGDGNLKIYSFLTGNANMTVKWTALTDQCQVFGYCGNLGICSYVDSNPVCGCPSRNFEPVDLRDVSKGCKRKVEIGNCSQGLTVLELEHTKLFTYEKEEIYLLAMTACRLNCLSSSTCSASTALADGTGFCYLKMSNFVSGVQSDVIPSTSYVKVCGLVLPNGFPLKQDVEKEKWWRWQHWIVVLLIVAATLGLISVEAGVWWCCCRKGSKFGNMLPQYTLLEYASGAPVQFSYKELHQVTRGFKDKLGGGGFGSVYKGVLADRSRTVVAVKQLEGIDQGERQFRMEVASISSTHHLNLVRLVGFCAEGRRRLLVYEFMKYGSLDNFLFTSDEQLGKKLNWEYRFNIAIGTGKGITYLHEECRDCIVHCDIKPENILLDENFNVKVSDFGLAKLISSNDHKYRSFISVRGTRGYLAPEWLGNLRITSKSDVYSYGMVLLEIVSGKRNFEVSAETNSKKFSIWAYEEFEKGNLESIIDKRLANQKVDIEQVKRAIQVSFWCIQEQPSQRPKMGKVVQMLEGITEIQMPPAPKAAPEPGTSIDGNSNVNCLSSIVAPTPPPSLSSSSQISSIPTVDSRNDLEGTSSSLLRSFQLEI